MRGRGLMPVGFLLIAVVLGACTDASKATPSAASTPPPAAPFEQAKTQRSAAGDVKVGNASIYSDSLQGKPMANGKPYDPDASVAASKTLPLGTVAQVTNLENGKTTQVRVEDRGPMVKGRVVDLAPAAARKLGLTQEKGIARVAVRPVATGSKPQADGEP